MPELTDAARNAIADAAAATGCGAGIVAAGTTAVAATASPPVKPIIGTVAVGATVIGGGAAAIEQFARPNIGRVVTDGSTTVLQTVSEGTGPGRLLSPVTNEAIEAWKASGSGKALQEWVNNQFRSGK
ncbi:hypothetical protein [uncultured Hydrogenophaga sp.]|uniref:hypothetical protein n=1 Tax=uncultured Hydrogenophaga sp. TaxID=199683 RepID=UPI0025850917|nr:hypothetical protein [uncultured Hydrogenophaga sp.]